MRLSRVLALLICLAVLLLAACGISSSDLLGTSWRLVEIDGQAPPAGTEVTLSFRREQLEGYTGCNHYFGSYLAKRGRLAVEGLNMTERGCLEPEGIHQQENRLAQLLSHATHYERSGDELRILCEGGEVLVFAPADD